MLDRFNSYYYNTKLRGTVKTMSIIFQYLFAMFLILILINEINCFWMTYSWSFKENYIRIITKDFKKHDQHNEDYNKMMERMFIDLYDLLKNEMYLMVLTLSVVGYGDEISMPDLTYFKEDYTLFTFIMLAGWLGFSLCNSHIISIIDSIKEPVSALKIQNDMTDDLEVFFVINNTLMLNTN